MKGQLLSSTITYDNITMAILVHSCVFDCDMHFESKRIWIKYERDYIQKIGWSGAAAAEWYSNFIDDLKKL